MLNARVVLDRDFVVGDVDPRLFGGFVEHMGRCVYGGLYEPGHTVADKHGFRADVLELVRELDLPVVRYPGGNFVSGYNWEDGVGQEARPRRLDLAWKSTEPNTFGTNEFVTWCRKAGAEPMLAVNLGTRGPDAARNLVEYCNHPGGSAWSDLRRKHGFEEPHAVKLWCLGNEVDGPWQMGHKTADEYGRVACETAKLMKGVDPDIELVACGSSGRGMPTFGDWERTVLDHTLDHVEYISLHTYYGKGDGDTATYLARPEEMGDYIDAVVAACDLVAARRRSSKQAMLSFDEWNVWQRGPDRPKPEPWAFAPHLAEGAYTVEDALVVGGMLITLLNHCDRVRVACIAQVVNVLGPIMTAAGGPAWRNTIFFPFADASRLGRGLVLQPVTDVPTYDTADRPAVPYLAASYVLDPETGGLAVLAVNRHTDEPLELALELRAFDELKPGEWRVLRHDDLDACNTADSPDAVAPGTGGEIAVDGARLTAVLAPASWNAIRLLPA